MRSKGIEKILRLGVILLISFRSISQGYRPTHATFFRIGDSIKIEAECIFGNLLLDSLDQPISEDILWLADFMQRNAFIRISIHAHTDTRGSFEKNRQRSLKTAKSIESWLQSQAIDVHRISAEGWGESKPIISEQDIDKYLRTDRFKYDSLHRLNKRVVIHIEDVQKKIICDYRPAKDSSYWKYYAKDEELLGVNNRFRLDFISRTEALFVHEKNEQDYQELVHFITCNPSVVFGISVHDKFSLTEGKKKNTAFVKAEEIIDFLHANFGLSKEQLEPIEAGIDQPIIPKMVLDQLEQEKELQTELNALNERIELVIVDIGVRR